MKNFPAILLVIIALFSTHFSQASGGRVSDPTGAYSFITPVGWSSNSSDEGFGLVNPQRSIVLAIKVHGYNDFAAFGADANLERDGLELVGTPKEITGGAAFTTTKNTAKGTIYIHTCVLFSPHGGGMVIVAISNQADSAAAMSAGLSIAGTVQFTKPKQSTGGHSVLSGKHLLYIYSGNGYSERMDIYLCASGGFYHSTSLGGFTPNDSDGSSFGSQRSKHGTWRISQNGAKLILNFQNGRTTEYNISKRQASNEIGLNGTRFFVQTQNICR